MDLGVRVRGAGCRSTWREGGALGVGSIFALSLIPLEYYFYHVRVVGRPGLEAYFASGPGRRTHLHLSGAVALT